MNMFLKSWIVYFQYLAIIKNYSKQAEYNFAIMHKSAHLHERIRNLFCSIFCEVKITFQMVMSVNVFTLTLILLLDFSLFKLEILQEILNTPI